MDSHYSLYPCLIVNLRYPGAGIPDCMNRHVVGAQHVVCVRRELQDKVSAFVLRRTQQILSKHLPPLSVFTIFCKPSKLQVSCCLVLGEVAQQ